MDSSCSDSPDSGTDDEPKTAQFDVETILASRIYKRVPTRLNGVPCIERFRR